MERKLVKQGRNALTVTLPAQWLKSKGLNAGDSVYITEENKQLTVATTNAASKTCVTLDLVGCEKSMIYHAVMGKYIEGYDTIIVHHDCAKTIPGITKLLMGMIIAEATQKKIVLKSIISVPDDNFELIMRRAVHIFVQQARTLASVTRGGATFDDVKEQEVLLDQNVIYCLRYLNKYETQQHSYRHFLICSTLELAADQVTRVAKHIGKQRQLADAIVKGIEEYSKHLFAHDLGKMYASLRAFRNSIGQKTFADGLAYSLAEILYNYLGYIMSEQKRL